MVCVCVCVCIYLFDYEREDREKVTERGSRGVGCLRCGVVKKE